MLNEDPVPHLPTHPAGRSCADSVAAPAAGDVAVFRALGARSRAVATLLRGGFSMPEIEALLHLAPGSAAVAVGRRPVDERQSPPPPAGGGGRRRGRPPIAPEVQDRIRALRFDEGLSYEEIRRRCGVSRATVARYIRPAASERAWADGRNTPP